MEANDDMTRPPTTIAMIAGINKICAKACSGPAVKDELRYYKPFRKVNQNLGRAKKPSHVPVAALFGPSGRLRPQLPRARMQGSAALQKGLVRSLTVAAVI